MMNSCFVKEMEPGVFNHIHHLVTILVNSRFRKRNCLDNGQYLPQINLCLKNNLRLIQLTVFQMLVLATFFPTSDASPGFMDFVGVGVSHFNLYSNM